MGDVKNGHGSHVAGIVLGNSLNPSGTTYNGMAKGAKLAFFDIGDTFNELYVPDDLAKWLYPTSYSGNLHVIFMFILNDSSGKDS